ncbi:MAG: branched-chain amino acid ABC transporter permease [Rhodospirillales bacterium]|nr:branched-chain amino acid ABC transporter permease [Rhodospirillales bacterium]
MSGLPRLRSLAAVFALLGLWPFFSPNDYIALLGVGLLVNVGLIAGLNLIAGYCGQVSLCHAAFFGLGAYASGVLCARLGVPPVLGLPAALFLAGAAALAIGLPSLRLHGHYLAMATLGFNAILSVLFSELVSVTGGPNGLLGVPGFSRTFGAWIDTPFGQFFVAWIYAFVCMAIVLRLLRSRAGRAMRAVAFSELAAGAMGTDTARLKVTIFVLTAMMAGGGGWVYVHVNQFASPETFGFLRSVLLVAAVAIGGWGRFWGPVPGALVLTLTPELLGRLHDFEMIVFGGALVAVLLVYPGGISAGLAALGRRFVRSGT